MTLALMPNPFNSTTTIRFSAGARSAPLRLAIYDLSGRMVSELSNGRESAGRHTVVWQAGALALPSGIYLVVLEEGEKRLVQKAVLMR